jgi:hypothetical protein
MAKSQLGKNYTNGLNIKKQMAWALSTIPIPAFRFNLAKKGEDFSAIGAKK